MSPALKTAKTNGMAIPPQVVKGFSGVRGRCPSCRKGVKPPSDLARSASTDQELLPSLRQEIAGKQAAALIEWCEICTHSSWTRFEGTEIARGSEHAVFLNEGDTKVTKITPLGQRMIHSRFIDGARGGHKRES
jgi:hypothetical protein